MRRNPVRHTCPVAIIGFLLFGLTAAMPATADHERDPAQTSNVPSQLASPPSLLEVTGTTNRFNVTASHADVLSVLKAIFEQSHQQFAPDSSVSGEVTLVLTGQPFNVVLASVCKQTFLRYEIDRNGIYQFKRDDEAVREGFARIRIINSEIAQQLQRLGFTLAPSGQNSNVYTFKSNLSSGAGGAMGGFGGGGNVQARIANGVPTPQSDSAESGGKRGLTAQSVKPESQTGSDSVAAESSATAGRTANRSVTPNTPGQPGGSALNVSQEPLSAYDQMLRDNGLVGIHVPRDQPIPIAEALRRFSRQANVPILVDPQLQGDHPLRFYGTLVRPLPDALNLLLPAMHLEWRYTGSAIFVTESPDFGIFYGISNIPKVVYPGNLLLQQAPSRTKSTSPPPSGPRPAPKPANGDN